MTASAREAAEKVRAIARYDAWEAGTKAIFDCEETLNRRFGRKHAGGILELSRSCLTGEWDRVIRRYRRYAWLKERRIWLKEALQRVLGGK